ncbi:unnamed protein product [Dibothriocephalus latus]|uniref:Uncharacterized protein n=1 Tax=Dibothriocephalus latus TaxID=60516 RepID=A0A3P7Q1H9_DIBLA|nr:unnamed protein product [Dibothriocephalus latus]
MHRCQQGVCHAKMELMGRGTGEEDQRNFRTIFWSTVLGGGLGHEASGSGKSHARRLDSTIGNLCKAENPAQRPANPKTLRLLALESLT